MKATDKVKEINDFLAAMSGRDRVKSIETNTCSWCGQPANEFFDELSKKEYRISGMCQKCQDNIFNTD